MTSISPAVRREVRERAKQRCEYCRKPDSTTAFGHQVDHILSLKQGGTSDLDNLAYACLACNKFKGSDIAAYDEDTGDLIPFYNPRKQNWDEHFILEYAHIIGQTAVGRVTMRIFQLNHPKQLEIRRDLIDSGQWSL